MERFVRLLLGGGFALVAGLWTLRLTGGWRAPWLVGAALVALGIGGLAVGIGSELEVDV